ncbi:hypothetical protein [Rhizosaccharibacter radicis]|uniref:Uncharacterized protein n=1 Tax=Rhizosaccharibacter radicis TaxID=2782605 RepID=A0ABT1VT94_9PROT|nr:hypothetical protein [Acetobacteraceae bacterium KSS12]
MIPKTGRTDRRGIDAAIADVTLVLDRPGILPHVIRQALDGFCQQQKIAPAGMIRLFCTALLAELPPPMFLHGGGTILPEVPICSLLSTVAVIGALRLIDIGAEMTIFLVTGSTAVALEPPRRDVLRQAARNRLRPITMTMLSPS